MTTLPVEEFDEIAGGVDWGAVGAGVASIGVGIAIAATPVGWLGAAGAAMFSFGGGFAVGTGFMR